LSCIVSLRLMPGLVVFCGLRSGGGVSKRFLNGATVTVCRVDLCHDQMQLFGVILRSNRLSVRGVARCLCRDGPDSEFAMNCGCKQAGLLARGSVRERWARNSIRSIGTTGPALSRSAERCISCGQSRVAGSSTEENSKRSRSRVWRRQCGPMLVHQGGITTSPVMAPAFAIRANQDGCVRASPARLICGHGVGVTCYEFAEYFLERQHCAGGIVL